jgi:hypothetical protein
MPNRVASQGMKIEDEDEEEDEDDFLVSASTKAASRFACRRTP